MVADEPKSQIDEPREPIEDGPAEPAADEAAGPASHETAEKAETPAEPVADAAAPPAPTQEAESPAEAVAEEPLEEVEGTATTGDLQEAEAPADTGTADIEATDAETPQTDATEETADTEPTAEEAAAAQSEKMDWYILKVQSNREESIRDGLMRRVAIAGLEECFGEVIVPTEKITEFKGGKKRVMKRKLYPGYLVVQMEINDDTWFLVRETPGIGDFTGAAGAPTPMLPHEVSRILARQDEKSDEAPKLKIAFSPGDRVKITEGTFENFEGEVDAIDETNGRVTVMINIFGRSTPVELEYWQIESI